ncbi:hypothetical protein GCM10018779_45920 [Streptomyces griseocarneus]|nr:hypothetical protein GCM10018779_45920 [Streptomyces griseocarneus]
MGAAGPLAPAPPVQAAAPSPAAPARAAPRSTVRRDADGTAGEDMADSNGDTGARPAPADGTGRRDAVARRSDNTGSNCSADPRGLPL